ncbi:MAG: tandem-95 repeat protein, partial [Pedosphaera sp.]|nr:tandem-95 repeat protein [Pedosphaera sp.]
PNLVYLPNPNVSGTDSFTYKVNDGTADSALATVSITIAAVNDAPVAKALTVEAIEDTAKVITLAGVDVEGSALSYTVVTGPINGTLTGTSPNLVYLPNPNVSGTDSFTYKVNDGTADSALATVSITIAAVNDAPEAFNVFVNTEQGSRTEFSLAGSDSEGAKLTYTLLTQPTKGTLSGNAPDFVYTPGSSASGTDSFTYKVNDGTKDSAVATVTIEIATIEAPTLTIKSSDGVTLSLEARASEGVVVTVEGSTELGIWLATSSKVTGKGMDVAVPLSLKIDPNVGAQFWRLNIR